MLILILSILVLGTIISSLYITFRTKNIMNFKEFYGSYMINREFHENVKNNVNDDSNDTA